MENSMEVFQKQLKREQPYDPAILLLDIYLKKNENRYVHHNVPSSTIYDRQGMEAK